MAPWVGVVQDAGRRRLATGIASILLVLASRLMPAVHVRDVPPDVLAALKRRARRHHRSLQGELREVLSIVALEERVTERLPPLALRFSSASPSTSWGREEIYGDDGR
jgi:plasmid stability protein